MKTKKYTVRIEWPVTYYCDTTVRATTPEQAASLAMKEPDYDSQDSYDDSGDSYVAGVSEGDEFDSFSDFDNGVPPSLGAPIEVSRSFLELVAGAADALPPSRAVLADELRRQITNLIN